MKFTKLFIGLFAFLLLSAVASALSFDSSSLSFSAVNQQKTIVLSNDFNSTQDITLSLSPSSGIVFSYPSSISNLANGSSRSLTVSVASLPSAGLKFGTYSSTLTATGSEPNQTATATINFVKSFCTNGAVNESNLSINNIDISNSGAGKDDEWEFLDTVSVDVKVEAGDEDVDDVIVKLALFDSSGKNVVGDLDFINTDEEEIDLGDLNDGDKETASFEFKVPADMDSGNYKLAVKTYSKKSGVGETVICDDSSGDLSDDIYESISINEADDDGKFIAFDNTEISPADVTCGDTVSLDTTAYNVGKDDEDKVKVRLVNTELGLDQSFEIKNGLDRGDNQRVAFTFTVPSNVASKTYSLKLSSEYDYRNGIYRQDSDEDSIVLLKVLGCAPVQTVSNTGITASLESDAVAGQEMVVSATIKNLGSSSGTFVINVDGYSSWADLTDVSDKVLSLDAGESKEVVLTFNVKSTASGDESFVIESVSNGKTDSKEVQVSIEGSKSVGSWFKNNTLAWVIGLVNLILIILIIVIAIRVARR